MADVWWIMLVLGTAVLLLFIALMVRALVRGKGDDGKRASRRLIVGGGVVLPAVVITVIFAASLSGMGFLRVGGSDIVIEITGHQWWWEVHYPNHDVTTANEIHMPVGETVELRLTSADVIHSFWVPSLGGKMDLLPDRVNTMEFSADEPGEYRGACAEFCGTQHAKMGFVTVAESPAEFNAWVESQSRTPSEPTGSQTTRGSRVFHDQGCGDCHTIDGTDADGDTGPDLTHIASRMTLAAGTLTNTTGHLENWIRDPQEIKEGANMPALEIGDDDLEALVEYLETLE